MSFKSLLNKTCAIRRLVVTGQDAYNKDVGSFDDLATGVACALQAKRTGNREVFVANQAVVTTHVLFLEPRDVTEQDQIVVEGATYDVLTVRSATGRAHHLELDLRRVS